MVKTQARGKTSAASTGGSYKEMARGTGAEVDVGPDYSARWAGKPMSGSRTPWGLAQHVTEVAPGIVVASCAQHGGVKLSPQRNAQVPAALRNQSGWYEEDCESWIPVMCHPDAWPDVAPGEAEAAVKDTFPDEWEKATGRVLGFGESSVRDERLFKQQHAGELAVTSAALDDRYPGMVVVDAAPIGGRERSQYLVPDADYLAARGQRFGRATAPPLLPPTAVLVAPAGVAAPPKAPKPACRDIDLDKLTERQQQLARNDLAKRWRLRDGRVMSLAERVADGQIVGKSAVEDGQKRAYYLLGPDSEATPVSKATWDAVGAPDDRSDGQRAHHDARAAWRAYERAKSGWSSTPAEVDRLFARAKAMEEAARPLLDAEEKVRRAEWEASQVEPRARLDAAYRAATGREPGGA